MTIQPQRDQMIAEALEYYIHRLKKDNCNQAAIDAFSNLLQEYEDKLETIPTWSEIFNSLKEDSNNGFSYDRGIVNYSNLTSHIEEVYVRIADLERKQKETATLDF